MVAATDHPDVSLVLEYENAVYVGDDQAHELVAEVARQAREAPFSVEVLVPDDADVDAEAFAPLPVRRFDASGAHYYDVKTAGARAARGDVIVFADSDVRPLEGWLESLVAAMSPDVDVAVGATIIRPVDRVVDKTFAASTWFTVDAGAPRRQLLANNMAVRPAVFLPDGFPPIGCRYRGSCRELDHRWTAEGVRMAVVPRAASHHPAPTRPFTRAMWDGHDQRIEHSSVPFLAGLARVAGHQLVVGSARLVRNRRVVDLRWSQLPLALLYNLRESVARALGFTVARFAHDAMHRRVPQQ